MCAQESVRDAVWPPQAPQPVSAVGREPEWADWSDGRLLDVRLCDLGVDIAGSEVERWIAQLYDELKARDLIFQPSFWLSDDWFTPDGVPGCALPFYLAHPRLARLEQNQMLEVEGGTHEWGMAILRHETGHAIENAFRLRLRRRRRQLFGKSSAPYPDYYTPRPYSKSFVLHLDYWYAQSHPDEDFAETFAVWLNPDSMWRERYVGWPALRKLEYVDELMRGLVGLRPPVTKRRRVDPLSRLSKTLREHYQAKREHYQVHYPGFYDRDLRRLFSSAAEFKRNMTAARFLNRIRKEARRRVAEWTGEFQYTIDRVFEDMIERCQELHLRLTMSEEQTEIEFMVLLTVQVMNYLHSGRHRVAL